MQLFRLIRGLLQSIATIVVVGSGLRMIPHSALLEAMKRFYVLGVSPFLLEYYSW